MNFQAEEPLSNQRPEYWDKMALRAILQNIAKVSEFVFVSAFYNEYTIARHFRSQGAQIGDDCRFFTRFIGNEPYLVKIGDHVTVAAGVTFITHDGAAWSGRLKVPDLQVFGPIVIGNNCVIGQNAILFPNIHIGENCIIGAGSVVISDIPPNTLVMGVPARQFGSVEKYKDKCIERWKEQKPPGIVIEAGADWWNTKHYSNNRKKLKAHLIKMFWENPPSGFEERDKRPKEVGNKGDEDART